MPPIQSNRYVTQNPGQPENFWQPLYDRIQYPAAGSAQLMPFSIPRGQNATLITNGVAVVRTKTYRDTNIESANVTPSKRYDILGISLGFVHLTEGLATNPADRDRIKGAGWLRFRIIDKDVLFLPTIFVPELNAFSAISTTANNTTMAAQTTGAGTNMYKLGTPVTLEPYQNFTFELNFDGAALTVVTAAVDLIIGLQSYVTRPT